MNIGIIGAGASGVVLAILLAEKGYEVTIIERKDRILKKLLVTGNGTCNYTNVNASYSNYFSIDKEISKDIFEDFSYKDVLEFFSNIGIEPSIEDSGKVYPNSYQASSVVDALRFKLESFENVNIVLNEEVEKIRKKNNKFNITTNNREYIFDNIVLATGGNSYKELGSNGSGYILASKMGHTSTELYPILVQLKSDKEYTKGLEGVKLPVILKAFVKGEKIREDKNELLFTPYGISGPTVFNLSYLTALYGFENIDFYVDFLPNIDKKELKKNIFDRIYKLDYLNAEYLLNGLINKKLAIFLLKKSGVEKLDVKVSEINKSIIDKLVNNLKNYHIKVYDTTGFSNAQVTAGGIRLSEVNNLTLESKKVKGLYIIGEVLDIFGDCGGYNLTWCFMSSFAVARCF